MSNVDVSKDEYFTVGGLKFRAVVGDPQSHKTGPDEVIIRKKRGFLRQYAPIMTSAPTRNALEFGIFEGGSLLYFALTYPHLKFVGIDIRKPNQAVLDHIKRLGLEDRVKIYYETGQTDRVRIAEIISKEFGDEPIGTIIDDASHQYEMSKTTFESTFGFLAPGGHYCLEDWAWAHWDEPYQTKQWVDAPALSNLVFEIVMLYPSGHGLIDGIDVRSNVVFVRRGVRPLHQFTMEKQVRMRGKKLVLI